MRIQGVTGDLPAVAHLMNEGLPKVDPPSGVAAPTPAVTAPAAAGDAGGGHSAADDRRRPPALLHDFDPPLIAQRAALGLPVGPMVAAHAVAEGITYCAAWAAVDREMTSHEASA